MRLDCRQNGIRYLLARSCLRSLFVMTSRHLARLTTILSGCYGHNRNCAGQPARTEPADRLEFDV